MPDCINPICPKCLLRHGPWAVCRAPKDVESQKVPAAGNLPDSGSMNTDSDSEAFGRKYEYRPVPHDAEVTARIDAVIRDHFGAAAAVDSDDWAGYGEESHPPPVETSSRIDALFDKWDREDRLWCGHFPEDDCPCGPGSHESPVSTPCESSVPLSEQMGRYFDTGAYRDSDNDKYDYEGFLSPLVLEAYAAYMHRHRLQSDGQMRDSDNWQRGIPQEQYMKSAWRHLIDLWREHRGYPSRDGIDEALGGLLFNVMGFWHELLKGER